MDSSDPLHPLVLLAIGLALIGAILSKMLLDRFKLSPVVGFILLGVGLRATADRFDFHSLGMTHVLEFLGRLGVIVLLFRVGLETNITRLLQELDRALALWVSNMIVVGGLGYLGTRYVFGLDVIQALFVTTALTATSVAVSLAVWEKEKALGTRLGALLLDTAELDDLSGVVLLTLLFGLIPLIHEGNGVDMAPLIGKTVLWLLFKMVLFASFCLFFSRFIEERISELIQRAKHPPDPMLVVLGVGMVIASIADFLGFSAAVGALFAGLIFSRDSEAVRIDASFDSVFDLFGPFFFILIGFKVSLPSLEISPLLPLGLLVLAVLTKLMANLLPLWRSLGPGAAWIMGLSMVPRAEIAMVVMERGSELGDWAVPDDVFASMVIVTLATCFAVPLLLTPGLKAWPPGGPGLRGPKS